MKQTQSLKQMAKLISTFPIIKWINCLFVLKPWAILHSLRHNKIRMTHGFLVTVGRWQLGGNPQIYQAKKKGGGSDIKAQYRVRAIIIGEFSSALHLVLGTPDITVKPD